VKILPKKFYVTFVLCIIKLKMSTRCLLGLNRDPNGITSAMFWVIYHFPIREILCMPIFFGCKTLWQKKLKKCIPKFPKRPQARERQVRFHWSWFSPGIWFLRYLNIYAEKGLNISSQKLNFSSKLFDFHRNYCKIKVSPRAEPWPFHWGYWFSPEGI
jgi:hypothetical protein